MQGRSIFFSFLNPFPPSVRRVLGWSLFFHLLAAVFSEGYYQADEHFQILEFISLKLGKALPGDLPWEFGQQMRPWLQPGVGWLLAKGMSVVGVTNPFFLAFVYRLLSGILGWASVVALAGTARTFFSDEALYFKSVMALSLLWFFPYLHVRFSSEGWAATFFVLGFCALWHATERNDPKSCLLSLLAGLAWGVSFHARYAVLVMIATTFLYFLVFRRQFKKLGVVVFGVCLVGLLGLGADYWGYGTWRPAAYAYFKANLLENRLSTFGVSPWWMYFRFIPFDAMPWCGWPLIVGTLAGIFYFPKHVLTWIVAPFLLVHFCLGHKETRFLFPIAPFAVLLALKSVEKIPAGRIKQFLFAGWGYRMFCAFNLFLLLAVSLKAATNEVPLYRAVYQKFPPAKQLLAREEDPYSAWGLRVHFYAPQDLVVRVLAKEEPVKKAIADWQPPVYVATHLFFLPEDFGVAACEPVFRTLPAFVVNLNYFHWIERTPLWSFFACKAS